MFLILFLATVVPLVLLVLTLMICKENWIDRTKISPFECGFETFSSARIIFSLKFYLIVIIFLVFDAEIALVLPLPLSSLQTFNFSWLLSMSILIFVLIWGLFIEWKQGAMSWSYCVVDFNNACYLYSIF